MEKKEPTFFRLDGFEAGIDVEHNVVTLVLRQVRLSSAPPVQIASMLSADQADTVANALREAAAALRSRQKTGASPRH